MAGLRYGGYIFLMLLSLGLVLSNFISLNKRSVRKSSFLNKLYLLSENKYFKLLLYKKGSKGYKKIEQDLKNAGFKKISVEQYQIIQYLIPLVVFVFFVAVGYTNIISTIDIETLNKISEITGNKNMSNSNKRLPVLPILLFSLLFYYFPKGILYVLKTFRNNRGTKEILMLQTYAIMMLKTGSTVKNTLISLMERADIYKEPLEITVKNYSKDPYTALEEMKDLVGHPNFKKVAIALQQALNNDKNLSIKYLETNRKFDKELGRIAKKEKTQTKKIIGLILLGLPLIVFAFGIGWPWITFAMNTMSKSY